MNNFGKKQKFEFVCPLPFFELYSVKYLSMCVKYFCVFYQVF